MKESIFKFGKILSRKEQKAINAGARYGASIDCDDEVGCENSLMICLSGVCVMSGVSRGSIVGG